MPGSYINSMQRPHDFQDFKGYSSSLSSLFILISLSSLLIIDRYLEKHLKAYPYAETYPYALKSPSPSPSLATFLKMSLKNIPIIFTERNSNANISEVASRLYDTTENIISNFERYVNANNTAT